MEFLLQLLADFFGGEVTENQESFIAEKIEEREEELIKLENEQVVEEPNLFSVIMFR